MSRSKEHRLELGETLQKLKSSVNLAFLFEAYRVPVLKVGRSLKALCPFHKEATPSMSIDLKKGVYHCFGCGESGDHISFLQKHLNQSFSEAVAELRKFAGEPIPDEKAKPEKPFPYELMARLAQTWQQAFEERPEGLDYLKNRGIQDLALLNSLKVGYCEGDSLIVTPEEKLLLQGLGILNDRGKEFFARCVVFPLYDREGRVVGFYGRGTLPNSKVPHRFCAGPKMGLFHPVQGVAEVFLVEGVLDSVAMMQAGFPNVMAMGGTQGLNAVLLEHLKAEKVKDLVLCLDADAAGQQANRVLESFLSQEGFRVRSVFLPEGQDPLSCPDLAACLGLTKKAQEPEQPEEKRTYRKLSTAQGKMKVLVCIDRGGEKAQATVDLFSSRSRKQEAMGLARVFTSLDVYELDNWFLSVLNDLESEKVGLEEVKCMFSKVEVPKMTAEERSATLAFLKQPNLVNAILEDMEALGYMGEEEAKLLGYCVSVSRKLEKPLSAIIQSGSGAGKSYLAETIQALTPPEDVVFYSRLSPQVLYYMPKDYLVHKLVGLEERTGGESCDYPIRTLQSSNCLKQCVTHKDPITGQLMARENEVLGPIAYLETTTSLRLNPENTSRCFEIPLYESPEQTRRIHARQKALKGLERLSTGLVRQVILQRHHHAQRLLQPLPVIIPYVNLLTFPAMWLRSRRDHDRFLHLIEVLAYLHQFQRPREIHEGQEYINATASDYRWAYFLAHRVLTLSMDELSRWARELLNFLVQHHAPEGFVRREIRQDLEWPDRRTREALEELVELEYLEVTRGANNLYTFHLTELKGSCASSVSLLHPDELESILNDRKPV